MYSKKINIEFNYAIDVRFRQWAGLDTGTKVLKFWPSRTDRAKYSTFRKKLLTRMRVKSELNLVEEIKEAHL